jgi:hypothetical protein
MLLYYEWRKHKLEIILRSYMSHMGFICMREDKHREIYSRGWIFGSLLDEMCIGSAPHRIRACREYSLGVVDTLNK